MAGVLTASVLPMARHPLRTVVRTLLRRTAWSPEPADGSAAPAPAAEYSPQPDGLPDPGEVVWAWVAFEEDPSRGKDRPVLVVGRDGDALLALQLTSRDHDLDADDEARYGRYWMDIGSGDWDSERRPSEVRLDRLLRLDRAGVRREGAALDRDVFDRVVEAARGHHALP